MRHPWVKVGCVSSHLCQLSQEQLADLSGVTRQTISSIETGQYVPSALLAFILADKLGKRVDELFTLVREKRS